MIFKKLLNYLNPKPSIPRSTKNLIISKPIYKPKTTLDAILYPKITPYNKGHLKVSEIHSIWYAEYGNSSGVPVLFVHGGPGAGCGDKDMRFFDPKFYRIVLFEQRGSGRSIPFGEIKENNTEELIRDIEKLRNFLKIEKWLIFGGSWGSALSMLYGEAYPDKCLGFILRGIYLGTKAEYEQLWYGMQDIIPEYWEEMVNFLPESERDDLIKSYNKRLLDEDPRIHLPAARSFMKYDLLAAYIMDSRDKVEQILIDEEKSLLGCARIFTYFSMNNFFLEHDQIIKNLPNITHLPAILIHGRYDLICRPKQAYKLYKNWPGSELVFVQDAGHSAMEIGIAKALVEATNKMKGILTTS